MRPAPVPERTASLWRHRDFVRLWIGQTASFAGSEVSQLAIPLTAVLLLGASAWEMGLLVDARLGIEDAGRGRSGRVKLPSLACVPGVVPRSGSRGRSSWPVLAASGVVGLVYGLIATEFLAAVTFPGPVFGIIIGLPVLALGVAKGVETARAGRH